jgi:hypothetical protein
VTEIERDAEALLNHVDQNVVAWTERTLHHRLLAILIVINPRGELLNAARSRRRNNETLLGN